MASPKFDYESDSFYKTIYTLAMQGMTDAEIASVGLLETLGKSLCPQTFSEMKNGCYSGWTEEENRTRAPRISEALSHARAKVNSAVRGRYLKLALGGIKVTTTIKRKLKVGEEYTDAEEIQVNESELPPNLQALSTWLNNHDPEWRRASRGEDVNDVPSFDISEEQWLRDHSNNATDTDSIGV